MLKKGHCLKKKKDIAMVLQKGKSIHSKAFSFKFLLTRETEAVKIAFICSKKVFPKAVQRNKVKRIMRHIASSFFLKINPGVWLVFFFKKEFLETVFSELKEQTEITLKGAGLLKEKVLQ